MPYEEDKIISGTIEPPQKDPRDSIPTLQMIHPDDAFNFPGMSLEDGRIKFLKEREILIKKLQGHTCYKHTCGITSFFPKKLNAKELDKLHEGCICNKKIPEGYHLFVCKIGHYTLTQKSHFDHKTCQKCLTIMTSDTPAETERRLQNRLARKEERDGRERFRKAIEKGKHIKAHKEKQHEAEILAKEIAKQLKPLLRKKKK